MAYIGSSIASLFIAFSIGRASSALPQKVLPDPPTLDGPHFRFTIVENKGWSDIRENEDGEMEFSGYSVDIIRSVASRANFTFDMLPPSGHGALCEQDNSFITDAYDSRYRGKYLCGQGDVQDKELRNTTYASDFYQGMFYITPKRRLLNKFTTPFVPPSDGGLQLFGTATHIRNIDDLIRQQVAGKTRPVCLKANTAYADFVRISIPALDVVDANYGVDAPEDFHRLLSEGNCDLLMIPKPIVTRAIKLLSEANFCQANGKPIGLVGDALDYGFTQFGIGVRKDMPTEVIDTIDYWMNHLMTCPPTEDTCDSFSVLYAEVTGNGNECGYEASPQEDILGFWPIVGIVLGVVICFLLLIVLIFSVYMRLLQRKRIKKRIVQQVARNIRITSTPKGIQADKLAQLFAHITQGKDFATEEDIQLWMSDINLPFLSDTDYAYLWKLIDVKGNGLVHAVEFFIFLDTCEKEFAEVYEEVQGMAKPELLKFMCRDLDKLNEHGEEEMRKNEFILSRRQRSNTNQIAS